MFCSLEEPCHLAVVEPLPHLSNQLCWAAASLSSGKRSGVSDRQRSVLRARICVREACGDANELVSLVRFVRRIGANDCRSHGGPIAGGSDAATVRPETQPEAHDRPQRRQAHAGGQSQKPPAQVGREELLELRHISARRSQGMRNEAGVLGVVAHHATSEQEAVGKPADGEASLHAPPRHAFEREPEGVHAVQAPQAFLEVYPDLIALGDGEVSTGGYAPQFLADWMKARVAGAAILDRGQGLTLSEEHREAMRGQLAAFAD